MKTRIIGLIGVGAALFQMNALALPYGLNAEFSNGTAPTGTGPWATVDLTDNGNSVLVTFSIAGSSDIGKLSEWYLNYNPNLDPTKLKIEAVDASAVRNWSVDQGLNKFKADGDGTYDLRFNFATSGDVFQHGETLQFQISSTTGLNLDPESFEYLSIGGARGGFHTAAHVQALANGDSGWVGDKPEPPPVNGVPDGAWTITLLGGSALGLELLRRRLAKQKAAVS